MYSAFCCYCCVIGPGSLASSTCTRVLEYTLVRLVVVVCVGASSYVLRPL